MSTNKIKHKKIDIVPMLFLSLIVMIASIHANARAHSESGVRGGFSKESGVRGGKSKDGYVKQEDFNAAVASFKSTSVTVDQKGMLSCKLVKSPVFMRNLTLDDQELIEEYVHGLYIKAADAINVGDDMGLQTLVSYGLDPEYDFPRCLEDRCERVTLVQLAKSVGGTGSESATDILAKTITETTE